VRRAVLDERERGDVPEGRRATVAEGDLVAVGEVEQLCEACAYPADDVLDRRLPVRRAEERAPRRGEGRHLCVTDLRGARAEAAVSGKELGGDLDRLRHPQRIAARPVLTPCSPKLCRDTDYRRLGSVSDLIDTTEMYLRTIYELAEEGIVPLRARIAERLGHSGPTVSQTVARMERDGLVIVSGDRHLELTEEGHAKAMRVMRKHRLAERLLTDVIGLEWEYVHDEACRWEHVMSDRVEKRLLDLLDRPTHSPYGNPIPGLGELGDERPEQGFLEGVVSLTIVTSMMADGESRRVQVARLGEPLQTDVVLLARLSSAGVVPGGTVLLSLTGREVTVTADGKETVLELPSEVSRHIFVAA